MLAGLEGVLLNLVAFVVVLGIVVFVHEFGHFQAARWGKVAIDTFSIGFGKTLASWRDKHGVQWRLGALPLGGYVKYQDDADPMSTGPTEAYDDPAKFAEARRKGLFHAMPLATRSFAVAAGPLTNFIFSTVAFALIAMIVGRNVILVESLPPRVDVIAPGSPAAAAGLRAGDVIASVDAEPVGSFGRLKEIVGARPGKVSTFAVQRGAETVTLQVKIGDQTAPDMTGVDHRTGYLGIERKSLPSEIKIVRPNPVEAIGVGASQVWDIIASTGAYVGNIFSGRASAAHIAGPAGIFAASGAVAKSAISGDVPPGEKLARLVLSLLAWAAQLSVAVGIVNLLPVPILDGGHLLFYAIEGVRGRPLGPKAQEIGYRAGFAFVASLFLFATWNDLQRFKLLEFLGGMLS